MMVVEDEESVFNSLFALMEKSDDKDDEEVTFLDIKENLKDYSLKEPKSLDSILIYGFCDLTK